MKKQTGEHPDPMSVAGSAPISRRTFIQGVVAASAATSLSAAPMAAFSPDATATGVLTTAQKTALTSVLNHLIPREGVMPAAGEIGIGSFIEQAISAAPHLRHPITAVLAALPEGDLARLSDEDMRVRLESVERTHPEAFDLLLQATYTGYYRHSAVLAALGGVEPDQVGEYRLDAFHPDDLDRLGERG